MAYVRLYCNDFICYLTFLGTFTEYPPFSRTSRRHCLYMWKNQTNSRSFEQNLSRTRVFILIVAYILFLTYIFKRIIYCNCLVNEGMSFYLGKR